MVQTLSAAKITAFIIPPWVYIDYKKSRVDANAGCVI